MGELTQKGSASCWRGKHCGIRSNSHVRQVHPPESESGRGFLARSVEEPMPAEPTAEMCNEYARWMRAQRKSPPVGPRPSCCLVSDHPHNSRTDVYPWAADRVLTFIGTDPEAPYSRLQYATLNDPNAFLFLQKVSSPVQHRQSFLPCDKS